MDPGSDENGGERCGRGGDGAARPPDDDPAAELLAAHEQGDERARADLFALLYDELRLRAGKLARGRGRNETLRATAIVHEVYLRLAGGPGGPWRDRSHFLAAAARTMRHVLIDYQRRRVRRKRQPDGVRVELDDLVDAYQERAVDLGQLDGALVRLAEFDPVMAHAIELRFFGGASVDETAHLLGMAKRTFERRFEAARAWLRSQIR